MECTGEERRSEEEWSGEKSEEERRVKRSGEEERRGAEMKHEKS